MSVGLQHLSFLLILLYPHWNELLYKYRERERERKKIYKNGPTDFLWLWCALLGESKYKSNARNNIKCWSIVVHGYIYSDRLICIVKHIEQSCARLVSGDFFILCLLSDLNFEWIPFEPRWNFVHFDDATITHEKANGCQFALPLHGAHKSSESITDLHTHRPSSSYSVNEDEGVVSVLLCRGLSTTKRRGDILFMLLFADWNLVTYVVVVYTHGTML